MNTKRCVYVCSTSRYPYGSPGAQIIQGTAKSILNMDVDAFVISNGDNIESEYDKNQKCYIHNGVKYFNVSNKKHSVIDMLKRADRTIDLIKKLGGNSNDAVILYSEMSFYNRRILNCLGKKMGMKVYTHLVEWHIPEQFPRGKNDITYKVIEKNRNKVVPKNDGVIAISNYIKKVVKNDNVFVLPALAFTENYPCKERGFSDKKEFIYSGTPAMKDDLKAMLEGILLLNDEEKSEINFHVTSVKRPLVVQTVGEEKAEKLDSIIVYHGWLEYEELIELYNKAHFLLLAKQDNVVSKANFPSKVVELMSCGVIPVCTAIGDIADYLTDGVDCILFDESTPEKVCESVIKALALSNEKICEMSANARKCTETKFDYKQFSEELVNFIFK